MIQPLQYRNVEQWLARIVWELMKKLSVSGYAHIHTVHRRLDQIELTR